MSIDDFFSTVDPLRTPSHIGALPKVEVFVDEFGDRGFTTKSSPLFAMAAIMVPAESVPHMRVVAAGLRAVINTPKPLHWVEHFTPKPKHAARRRLAADLVAGIPGVKVIYVVADKASLIASERLRADRDAFYNYVTKLALERVAFQAKHWPGGSRLAVTRLETLRHHDHEEALRYLDMVRLGGGTKAPFQYIKWPPRWHSPIEYDGLQIADLYMGMLACALNGEPGDVECAAYLMKHRHQVRRGPGGRILGWGVKVYGDSASLTGRAWWPGFTQ